MLQALYLWTGQHLQATSDAEISKIFTRNVNQCMVASVMDATSWIRTDPRTHTIDFTFSHVIIAMIIIINVNNHNN